MDADSQHAINTWGVGMEREVEAQVGRVAVRVAGGLGVKGTGAWVGRLKVKGCVEWAVTQAEACIGRAMVEGEERATGWRTQRD
jgi:hypothetical protein